RREGVVIDGDPSCLPAFWRILDDNLTRRHGTAPVHSLDEIALLQSRFPTEIRCLTALRAGEVVAGTVLFLTPTVVHTQYLASSGDGAELGAIDVVIAHALDMARASGARYFDFGHSNEPRDGTLNAGLFAFKASFGAGSTIAERFELTL